MFAPLRVRDILKMAPTRNHGPVSVWETNALDQHAFSLGRSEQRDNGLEEEQGGT